MPLGIIHTNPSAFIQRWFFFGFVRSVPVFPLKGWNFRSSKWRIFEINPKSLQSPVFLFKRNREGIENWEKTHKKSGCTVNQVFCYKNPVTQLHSFFLRKFSLHQFDQLYPGMKYLFCHSIFLTSITLFPSSSWFSEFPFEKHTLVLFLIYAFISFSSRFFLFQNKVNSLFFAALFCAKWIYRWGYGVFVCCAGRAMRDARVVIFFEGVQLDAPIFFGPTFYQRLKHMVDDKVHARCGTPTQSLFSTQSANSKVQKEWTGWQSVWNTTSREYACNALARATSPDSTFSPKSRCWGFHVLDEYI